MTKEALWEAVKEPLRLLVLAIIPVLLVYFQAINAEWAGVIIVILRLIDSVLHEVGKEQSTKTKESVLVTGLTRF
jgi:hypothetical protein